MARNYYCAKCGIEILVLRKAVRGKILDLVEPHECGDLVDVEQLVPQRVTRPRSREMNEKFGKFEFVQKLNNLTPPSPLEMDTGDKRPRESLRKEIPPSAAPPGIIEQIRASKIDLGEDPRTVGNGEDYGE